MDDQNNRNGPPRRNNLLESVRKRFITHHNRDARNVAGAGQSSGPIYPVEETSFVLKCSPESTWDTEECPAGIVPVVVHPQLISGLDPNDPKPLSDVQKEGLEFLWNRWKEQNGGILAHDMGLGKTRTAITLIATLLQQSNESCGKSTPGLVKCLILSPKNAVSVWEEEFKLWTPPDIPCSVEVIRSGQRNGWEVVNGFRSGGANVLILSYDSFLKYNSNYADQGFSTYPENSLGLIFCDEAHVLKNEGTRRVKNLRQFKGTPLWLGITGTPYQNNVVEFTNLVRFFFRRNPQLEDKDFRKAISDKIQRQLGKHGKLLTDEAKNLLKELRRITRPAIHFRANSLNKEKHEVTLFIPLDGHPDYYDEEDRASSLQHLLYQRLTQCLKDSEIKSFEKLSYLHNACIHPKILYQAMQKKANVFEPLLTLYNSVWSPENLADPAMQALLPQLSSKINVVGKLADFFKAKNPEEKMIIVSSSVVLLTMIKEFLSQQFQIQVLVYTGSSSEVDRMKTLDRFEKEDSSQFLLLSLKAGGTALTLTRANHILLLDPDYNPSNDRQALARIYRPGQNRPVFIFRLLSTGTLEENKFILQLGKEDMDKFFRSDTDPQNVLSIFKQDDLLEYHADTKSYIADCLDKIQIENFNNEYVDSTFAEEVIAARRYREVTEVPDNLPLVKEIWKYVSYAFHIPKVVDSVEEELFDICSP